MPRQAGAFAALLVPALTLGCRQPSALRLRSRAAAIPADAVKVEPGADLFPHILHLDGWEEPVPMPGPANTAGAEDSPFITPDGDELWFTGQSRLGQPGPAVFRSTKQPDGAWGPPVEVVSRLAANTLSAAYTSPIPARNPFTSGSTRSTRYGRSR